MDWCSHDPWACLESFYGLSNFLDLRAVTLGYQYRFHDGGYNMFFSWGFVHLLSTNLRIDARRGDLRFRTTLRRVPIPTPLHLHEPILAEEVHTVLVL